ncbi:phosphoribosyltransferase [Candidatus Dependentiae bacterium]
MIRFKDRADAGRKLVPELEKYKDNPEAIVIGLPRGGVVPAYEVAKALNLPLDIIVTRKIGAPMQPELALGALTQEGEPILDDHLISMVGVTKKDLEPIIQEERIEGQRRLALYRGDRPALDLEGKIAILVDDGLATGATMRAAIASAQNLGAQKIVAAVPVSPPDTLRKIKNLVDEVVCLGTPEPFWGVGGFYDFFTQTQDQEVIDLLKK